MSVGASLGGLFCVVMARMIFFGAFFMAVIMLCFRAFLVAVIVLCFGTFFMAVIMFLFVGRFPVSMTIVSHSINQLDAVTDFNRLDLRVFIKSLQNPGTQPSSPAPLYRNS